jgi:hypothetical protein
VSRGSWPWPTPQPHRPSDRRRHHGREDHDGESAGEQATEPAGGKRAYLPVAEQDDACPGMRGTSGFPDFSPGLAEGAGGALARPQRPVPSLHDERRVSVFERPPGRDDGTRAPGKEGAGQAQRPFAGDERAVRRIACRQHDHATAKIERGDLVGLQPSVLMVIAGCEEDSRALREGRVRAGVSGEVNNREGGERCVLDSALTGGGALKYVLPLRAEHRCDRPRFASGARQCGELQLTVRSPVRDGGIRHDEHVFSRSVDSRGAKPQPHRRGRYHADVEPLAQKLTRFERQRLDRHAVHCAVGDHDEPRDCGRHSRDCPVDEDLADTSGGRRPGLAARLALTQQPGTHAAGGQTHDRGFLYPTRTLEVSQPHYPHLNIAIWIERVENYAVENGGIEASQYWVNWAFDSSVATNIPIEMTASPIFPEINVPIDYPWPGRSSITAKCRTAATPTSICSCMMFHKPETVSDVTMNDHVPGLGHYGVYIPVHATEGDEASDFVFRGRLDAICTNILH